MKHLRYSLYHYSYKSWWSWMVSSMVRLSSCPEFAELMPRDSSKWCQADFAYTFGFVNMMPCACRFSRTKCHDMFQRALRVRQLQTQQADLYQLQVEVSSRVLGAQTTRAVEELPVPGPVEAHMPWRVLMYKFFNTFIASRPESPTAHQSTWIDKPCS